MGWLAHLLVDGALALGLLVAGIHGHGASYYVLDGAGAYLALAVAATAGPARRRRRLSRPAHRLLDGAVALGLVASPLLLVAAHAGLDLFATVIAEAVGLILVRDALVTRPANTPVPAGEVIEATALVTGEQATAPPNQWGTLARRLGRVAGSELPGGARKAGRTAGRLSRRLQQTGGRN